MKLMGLSTGMGCIARLGFSRPKESKGFIEGLHLLLSASLLRVRLCLGGTKSDVPNLQVIIPSAAYGGAIISFILCPTELVKCRMQVQGTDSIVHKHNKYHSPLDCALQTVKNEGVTGIFRGVCATLLRESVGNAVFFSVYENIRYHMHRPLKANMSDSNLVDMGIGIVSGGFGGVACWCAVLPFDVAKTIIQTTPDKTSTRNPFSVLNSIYRRAGLKRMLHRVGAHSSQSVSR